jgi:hypothetical protein
MEPPFDPFDFGPVDFLADLAPLDGFADSTDVLTGPFDMLDFAPGNLQPNLTPLDGFGDLTDILANENAWLSDGTSVLRTETRSNDSNQQKITDFAQQTVGDFLENGPTAIFPFPAISSRKRCGGLETFQSYRSGRENSER